MNILLTFEEYKQRAIDVIKETAKQTIAETASDYFKFEIIYMLTKKCFTNEMMCVDIVNQLYLKVFHTDRNGRPFSDKILKKITKKEVKEFYNQKWYKDREKNTDLRERMADCRILPCPKNPTAEELCDIEYYIEEVTLMPFDKNEIFIISHQVFKELYGHDYEVDREYKFSDCQTANEL